MKISFDVKKLQALLSAFHQLNKLTITCFDADLKCIAYAGGWEEYCSTIADKKELWGKCYLCDCEHAHIACARESTYVYTCHAELAEAIIPVFLEGTLIAYLVIGKFRDTEQIYSSREKVIAFAEKHDIDEEQLLAAYNKLPLLDQNTIRALDLILKSLMHYVCDEKCVRINRDEIAIQIDEFVTEHISEKLTAARLCKEFQCSKYALYDIFKVNFGDGPMDYIEKRRLQYTKELLSTTKEPLNVITEKVGFESFSYFSLWFKQKAGISPSLFRKEQQSKNERLENPAD